MSENTALVSLADTMTLGKVLAESGFFADSRQAAQAVVKVLAGREIGFGPVASMTGINIISGRVALSANLIASAVKRSGRYDYRVIELTDDNCRIDFFEKGRDRIGSSSFSKADATRAGTKNMDRFPRNMLFARAMSNGAKWYCADIFGGPIYTPEELGANVNEDGEVVDGESHVLPPLPQFTPTVAPKPRPEPIVLPTGRVFMSTEDREAADAAEAQPVEPPPSDAEAEFHAMTSAVEDRAAAPETHDSGAMATIDGAVAMKFARWCEKFANTYPSYRKDGTADMFHILKAVKAEKFSHITTANVTAVCDALRARAEAKVAGRDTQTTASLGLAAMAEDVASGLDPRDGMPFGDK